MRRQLKAGLTGGSQQKIMLTAPGATVGTDGMT